MKRVIIVFISVIVLVGALLAADAVQIQVQANQKPTQTQGIAVEKPDVYGLWQSVNNERVKAGEQPLKLSPGLDNSAQAKCNDMVTKNYWDHNSPDGVTPWAFITNAKVLYKKAGENLYYGYNEDSNKVVSDWMNSPGHRANILNTSFTDVGYAICSATHYQGLDTATIVVQHLIDAY